MLPEDIFFGAVLAPQALVPAHSGTEPDCRSMLDRCLANHGCNAPSTLIQVTLTASPWHALLLRLHQPRGAIKLLTQVFQFMRVLFVGDLFGFAWGARRAASSQLPIHCGWYVGRIY
jgi:hypothetical protein